MPNVLLAYEHRTVEGFVVVVTVVVVLIVVVVEFVVSSQPM